MQAAVLLYPGVTAFEALGPYGVLRRAPGAEVHLVARDLGPVPTQGSKVALLADATYEQVARPDVVVVPGGLGIDRLVSDGRARGWVASAHATASWTTSVSTGSVLLAAAGVLDGDATTHWLATELLEAAGAHVVPGHLVRSGNVLTAMGPLSGIEMALGVVRDLHGPEVADRIRRDLDVEGLGPMDPRKPANPSALRALGGPDDLAPTPAYVLGRRRPGRRRRWRPRDGEGLAVATA